MNIKPIESDFQMIGSTIRELSIKNPVLITMDENCDNRFIDLSHQISEIEEQPNGFMLGVVSLYIKTTIGKGKQRFRLNMSIDGAFIARNTDKEQFQKMLSVNGITATYSVARSIIIGITSQTFASGSVILPMINVFKYSKDIGNNNPEE